MSVTYTVTEQDGYVHTRTSRGHSVPEYLWAVVRVPHGRKHYVSYCSRRDLAEKQLADALKCFGPRGDWQGKRAGERMYPDAKMYPVTAVVK